MRNPPPALCLNLARAGYRRMPSVGEAVRTLTNNLLLLLLLLLPGPEAASSDVVYAWADVSITDTGVAGQVSLVEPALSPQMATPIENVIRQWRFSPAIESGLAVPRTTSVLLSIRLVTDANGGSRIEAEKLEEGPRILRKSHDRCLDNPAGAASTLTFTVNEEGRAVEISGPSPESESDQCVLKILRDTLFKPETVNGRQISRRITRQIRFK